MYAALYKDAVCSCLGQTAKEVKSRILNDDGFVPGEYVIRWCEFRTVLSPHEQCLWFKSETPERFKKPVPLRRAI